MSTRNTDSDDRRKQHLLRVARISLGILFLILGVVGSVLPILQGWIFFLLALITFFPSHPKVAKVLEKAEPRMPRVVRFLRKLGIGVSDEEASGAEREQTPGDEGGAALPSSGEAGPLR